MKPPETVCNGCGAPLPVLLDEPFCRDGHAPRIAPVDTPGVKIEIEAGPESAWRYERALPLPPTTRPISLGEGWVPLEVLSLPGLLDGVHALRDDLEPTGSWKDRGSTFLISAMTAAGWHDLVLDSAGNGALSTAHYAREAGSRLHVFAPDSSPKVYLEMLEEQGATVETVKDPSAARRAAMQAVREGAVLASHASQPLHAAGAATAAFNIVEKLGRVPEAVVLPVGNGGLLAGLVAGFAALAANGHDIPPRMIGIQPRRCAPLVRAFRGEIFSNPPNIPARPVSATEAFVASPLRRREALAAVEQTVGMFDEVDDLALDRSLRLLWREGYRVEATAALPVAWLLGEGRRILENKVEDIVVILTGAGVREGRNLDPHLI